MKNLQMEVSGTKLNNKNIITLVLSPMVMAIIMLLVFALRGIYPFGMENIAYYDMGHSYIPGYYHAYDVLHGDSNPFWSWYSGGGVSMYEIFGNYILHPFNLFFLFIKRNMILEAMSIFLMIKVAFSSFAMTFYCQKKYCDTSVVWQILCGIIYASQGYYIQYYSNIYFFDLIAIFPLIMYGLDCVIEKNKIKFFSLTMMVGFITNLQIMALVCFFIVIYAGIMLWGSNKEERNKAIVGIGCATIVAMCISAVVWLPAYFSIGSSDRAGDLSAVGLNLLSDLQMSLFLYEKFFMMYGMEVVIAILLYVFLFSRDRLKKIKKVLILNMLLIIPIFFEAVNIAWHIGGYVQFPMRFGFLLGFSMLMLANELYTCWNTKREVKKQLKFSDSISVIIIILIGAGLFKFVVPFQDFGIRDVFRFKTYLWIFIALLFVYFILLLIQRKNIFLYCGILIECFLGWYGFLAPRYWDAPEHDSSFIKLSEYVSDHMNIGVEDARIARVRDASVTMNVGYPFITQNGSMSNWTMGTNPELIELMLKLGYTDFFSRIMDSGASLFTDAFFHVEKIVTLDESEDCYHSVVDRCGRLTIKQNQLVYPFGIILKDKQTEFDMEGEENAFAFQNELFQFIHDTDRALFDIYDSNQVFMTFDENEYRYEFAIPVEGKKELYIQANTGRYYRFSVNNQFVLVPTIENLDNSIFPAYFNNGLLDCGLFDNETVNVTVWAAEPFDISEICFSGLNVELLEEQIYQQQEVNREIEFTSHGLKMKVVSDQKGKILLPIGFKDGMEVSVNGNKVKCEKAIGDALVLIPLSQGENEIILNYIPKGFRMGLVLTLVGIVLFGFEHLIAECIMRKKYIAFIFRVFFGALFIGILVVVYVVPMLLNIGLKILWVLGFQDGISNLLRG